MQFQQLRSLESFPAPIQPMSPLPSWAQPKALLNLRNISNDDVSREIGRRTLGGEGGSETRGFRRVPRQLDVRDRILRGFTLAERYDMLITNIYSTHPVFKFSEIYIYKDFNKS